MSTLEKRREDTASNDIGKALEQKREAIEGALKNAPDGRHAQEQAALKQAQEQLAGKANRADRPVVDAFFAKQREQVDLLQRAELEIVNSALSASKTDDKSPETQKQALGLLERAVAEVGGIHQEEHARLAKERADLESALAVTNEQQRREEIGAVRQRQEDADTRLCDTLDAARTDAAFAEGPGKTWTAAEETERKAAGATDQLRRDPEAFVREQGWKLPESALNEALDKLKLDDDRRRTLTDLAADLKRDAQIGPQNAPGLSYEQAELAGIRPAPRSTDEADNDNRHKRGNFGERAATDWLAANGYSILDYKPKLDGTTKPGIDIVAMKDDTVYLLDNKALSRNGHVRSVSALTKNLDDNVSQVKDALDKMANDATRTAEEIAVAREALDALEADRYVLAVTNANVARDDRILGDVSEKLKKEHDIEFIDVMRRKNESD